MKKASHPKRKSPALRRRALVLVTLASSVLWAGIGLGLSAVIQ